MNTQHTPGQWLARAGQVHDAHGSLIAVVMAHDTPVGAANERLIAAAPELLALLREIVEADDLAIAELMQLGDIGSETTALTNKAKALIAKATGAAPSHP